MESKAKPFLMVNQIIAKEEDREGVPGYLVFFPWEAKWIYRDTFLKWAFPMEKTNSVKQEDVELFLGKNIEMAPADSKTVIVRAEMLSGFVSFDTSSCIDPENFALEVGASEALRKIRGKLWEYLGFALQWGRNGLEEAEKKVDLG